MFPRARSVSRLRGASPRRETTPSIYDYGPSDNLLVGGGGLSSRLNVYSSDFYAPTSRSSRALSVARFKDIEDEILGTIYEPYERSYRTQSSNRYNSYKTSRPQLTSGTHDFDRYTERIRNRTPIAFDSHYTHYRPYDWYRSAPRTSYYLSPHVYLQPYRSLSVNRSPSIYSSLGRDLSLNSRFNDSMDRVSSIKRSMRDVDYSRELRELRRPTPLTYSAVTHGDDLLNRAREDVRHAVESRVGASGVSAKLNNPRDYFGRTYVQYEKDGITDVGVKYTGLSRSVDAKPSTWKAEDVMDMAYEIQALNDDTVDKLYENQLKIHKNRQWLLQDKAGVAPRMYHFDTNTRQARRDVDNALRLVRNLKQLKNETFARLSEPWKIGSYM
ncbi:unnamed protein product [Adineta ricciae]|uniref:Uncharacterized protein n=1 Tax=Adineta ricciae TaxID=249248 RepID=A0A814RIW0_ADIRI|nr:unnamed protein product [Adineta ricciae]